MKLRIDDAITLRNFKTVLKNQKEGRELHKGKLNGSLLGRMLYPNQTDGTMRISMDRLRNGKAKSVRFDQVETICKACGVDPNFLLGWPSKHDKEFNQINK